MKSVIVTPKKPKIANIISSGRYGIELDAVFAARKAKIGVKGFYPPVDENELKHKRPSLEDLKAMKLLPVDSYRDSVVANVKLANLIIMFGSDQDKKWSSYLIDTCIKHRKIVWQQFGDVTTTQLESLLGNLKYGFHLHLSNNLGYSNYKALLKKQKGINIYITGPRKIENDYKKKANRFYDFLMEYQNSFKGDK